MRKIEIIKNKKAIHSVDGWYDAARPEGGEKQWVDDHSAKELAKYCVRYDGFVPPEIDKLLDDIGIDSSDFVAEPEKQTSLCKDGFGQKGPRHHDLLMWNKQAVVGVEAKATETLDEYVTEKCKDKNGIVSYTPNQEKRYPGLCDTIVGKPITECQNIRYQLLSAAAGTLIEARKHKVNKAVLLVLLFDTKLVKKDHIELTKNDIDNFKACLKKNNDGSYQCPFEPNIELFVELLVIK